MYRLRYANRLQVSCTKVSLRSTNLAERMCTYGMSIHNMLRTYAYVCVRMSIRMLLTYIRAHNSSPSPDKIRTKLSNVRIKMPQFRTNSNTFPNYNFKMSGQFSNAVVSTVHVCVCVHMSIRTYMLRT